ncbi:glycoside hydrolase family 13 protein [Auriscalpium vulgare]|uniref:Glycoside hydrolase family 13 protein n=1 Tax=Auriscalpium vulgare TaxID=40419 RepID=A0ACB8S1S3_9AGAM|nr:glycoside hydrolase family 13 protein [Auriscalpium vulgare]
MTATSASQRPQLHKRISSGVLSKLVSWLKPGRGSARADTGSLSWMSLGPSTNSGNPTMLQFFTWDSLHPHVSWWKHFEAEVPSLADMGITQVWLPPPNKATHRNGQGYDAYDLWDLGEFEQKGTRDTRWGSKDELLSAIATAKSHGIEVLIDAVLNHKMGGDRVETFRAVPVDPENRTKDLGPEKEVQGWTAFDFTGRFGKYSGLRWSHDHFTGLDWDHQTRQHGVYRIVSKRRKGWSRNVDKELGNYDYLLGVDIDHSHPEVRKDMLTWGSWVLEQTGGSGFRLDAIKHIDRKFLLEWITTIRQQPGRSQAFMVAEYWSANVKLVLLYLRAFNGQTSFFDVPLHFNLHNASKPNSRFDLRTIIDGSVLKYRPYDAVTFVDNHDTQIGQSLESWVNASFKLQAYALILLRGEGHPCVFYGDLYPNRECYDEEIARRLRRLLRVRKESAYGALDDYLEREHCIGFVRRGDASHSGCVVVLSRKSDGVSGQAPYTIRMNVGKNHVNALYRGIYEPSEPVTTSAEGWGAFSCPPGSLQVWVPE